MTATRTSWLVVMCGWLVACGGDSATPESACKKAVDVYIEFAKDEAKEAGDEMPSDEEIDEERNKQIANCNEEMANVKEEYGEDVYKKVLSCLAKASTREHIRGCDPDGFAGKKKSKGATGEAREAVKKLYDGARAYFMEAPMGASLTPVEPQFPGPSKGPTPPLGTCCEQGGKCAPDATQWDDPVWIALQFSADDPHYYSYSYEVSDDRKEFTVRANGDLDCDGNYSTFEMYGVVDEDYADGPAATSSLTRVDELE